MRKFYGKTIGYLFVFVGILFSSGSLLSQVTAVPIAMPECTATVPAYEIDLSANPNLTFTTPEILREVGCCGDGDRYLAFYVTLNPNVAMIEIVVAPGYADPGGSGNYQIATGDLSTPGTCGPQIDAGTPLCITGAGPHKIFYSKPGGNLTKYIFRQIPSPVYPSNQPTRMGCTLPLPIYGLNNISITATSTTSSASLATCNTYLSCLNCDNPIFSPGANATYPYDITYQVTGTPQAAACGVFPTSGSFTVTVYDALNVSVTPNPASYCSGGPGATLTASATGGLGSYSYLWFNSLGDTVSTTNSYLATTAGTYTAEVKDGLITSTCPADFVSVPVTISPVPVVNAGFDTTVCATSPTAFLSGTSSTSSGVWSGGTGTFNPSATSLLTSYTPSWDDIDDGFVTLTLTSSNAGPGCTDNTDQVTIFFSDTVYANPAAAAIACYNGSTTINANATGGTLPYTYAWSNGTVGSSITATAGTYYVTVTDDFGCSDNTPITVSQPSPLGLNFVNTLDGGSCDGTATVTVSGGTTPYTYLWSTGGTTNMITGQCAGVYSVTVTDANLCTITQNVVINNATCSAFNATIPTYTDVDCFNGSNGTATASTVGGVGTIDYLWSPGGQTTQTATNLSSGTYTVMTTDDNGCVDFASVTILQPTVITNTMTHTDVTSIGGTDGTATANPLGGTPGYTYAWVPGGQTTQTATNLSSGVGGVVYYVDITDSKNCVKEDSVIINQPPCQNFVLAVNTTNVTCNGLSNGSASLVIANGTGPFAITWSNGATNVMSVSSLAAGTYSVTVTDASNCTTFQSFTITQPNVLSLGLVPTNITCYNDQDGTIDLTVSGGTYPFSYSWSLGGKVIANHEDLTMLVPGTYTVTITDMNGCTAIGSVGVTQPAELKATYTYVNNPCFGNSLGSIDVTPTGGVFPYTYDWTGPGSYSATTQDVSALATGGYMYTITDLNGCTYQENVNINQPPLLTVAAVVVDSVSCAGGNDGSINLTPGGGTTPYTYAWTGPGVYASTTEDPSGLAAGTYNVTVTDDEGCTASTSIVMPTIADTTDPIITCVGNQAVNTSSSTCTYTHSGTAWNATATDDCTVSSIAYVLTGATSGSGTNLNGVVFNLGVTTVTWTATDGLGNTDVCSYTVSVTDITLPTAMTCSTIGNQVVPADAGVCTYTHSGTAWNATATDNCSIASATYALTGVTTGTGTSLNGVVFNLGLTTVTWTFVDGSGNTATCSYTVTVNDTQNPTALNCATIGNQTVPANAGVCTYTHSGTAWNATASDNCSIASITYALTGVTTGTGTSLNGVVFNLGLTTVTWTATDGSGNTSTCSYTVTVTDTQNPTGLNCAAIGNQVVPANVGLCTYTHNNNTWNATATDNCSIASITYALTGATTGTGTSLNGVVFNLGVTTVTWTATDGSGNVSSCSYTVTVNDTQNPTGLNCASIGNQTVPANAGVCTYTHSGTTWNATASDNCSIASITYALTGVTTGTGTSLNGVVFNLGLTTVTWTATDGSGNTSTCSYTVTVTDTQNPTALNCATIGNQTVPANAGVCTYTHSGTAWNATASDNCSIASITYALTGVTTGTGTSLNGVVFNLGLTTVTWTATDGSGNTSTCSYTVTVTDTQNPTALNCATIGNQTVPANAGVCTYTHSGTAWNATASDNCSIASITYALTGVTTGTGTSLNGVVFNLGLTTVTWTATDGSGNTSTCSYTVTVTDNQVPTIVNCGAGNQSVLANTGVCTYTNSGTAWNATASDNCSVATVLYTLTGATTGAGTSLNGVVFNLGTTTVLWTVTDGSGNTSTCTYTVTVTDNQLPSILSCGATGNQTVNANTGICTYTHPNNTWNASATDNCSVATKTYVLTGATTGTGTTLSGVVFNLGLTTVTWTATDGSGNSSTCSFTVTVVDSQNPIITSCGPNLNQTVFADAAQCNYTQTTTAWNATATDNCSLTSLVYTLTGATTGTGTSLQGVDFNLGTTTVTWTATDGSGNISTCSFQVLVIDNQLPAISSCGATGTQNVSSNTGVCTFTQTGTGWDAVATDNCTISSLTYTLTGATTGTGTTLNGVIFNPGTTTVTWTVVDNSSNTSTCTFNVVVSDNQNPIISGCPTNITVGSDNGDCGAIVTWTVPTFVDNCGATMSSNHNSGEFFAVGTTTVTYTVTDGTGNTSICTFTVTVNDDEDPAMTCSTPIATCDSLVTYPAPIVSDNCGILSTVQTAGLPSGSIFPVGITVNTFQSTDIHGNVSTCSFNVTIFPTPVATTSTTDVTCNGFANGMIDLTVTTGTTPYDYAWSNGATTEDLSNLAPGTYTVDITDDNGCTTSASASITQPNVLVLTAEVDDVNCYNGNDGAIDITISGGTTPYAYSWSNGQTTQDLAGLTEDLYVLNVVDFNGCTVNFGDSIVQPDTLTIQAVINDATCNSDNGSIQILVTGGTTPYSYAWSNGSASLNLNNVVAGTYTLTVTDVQNCSVQYTGTIASVSNLQAYTIVKDATCYGSENGQVQVIVENGNLPYTYQWSNGASTAIADSLGAGSYSVLITDVFGCTLTLNVEINQPDSMYIELTNSVYAAGTNISTFGNDDGWITSDVFGGNSPYAYTWSNGDTTENLSNLSAGNYSLIVTDQNGCVAYASSRLTQPGVLEMPSGFSPNGDLSNDYFVVHGIEAYPENKIIVFNRWGNVVYELDNYANEWNGDNMKGEALPDGTYFVILTVFAEEDITLNGYVDLRR